VACAAGLKNIEIIERDDLVVNAREAGAHMQAQLQELSDIDIVGEIRGLGMMSAVELVKNKDTREQFDPFGSVGAKVADKTWSKGLITRGVGDTLALAPPLICTKEDIDRICMIMRDALEETNREVMG
jgi:adenosylmethionine-8-amino-7-oxononanoate aminotransferase